MKQHFGITALFSLTILIFHLLPAITAAAQENSVILRPDPSLSGMIPETQGTVKMIVENVQDMYGIEFHLIFDPNVVEVVDADPAVEGIQIQPADWWDNGFVAVNQVDNERGKIDFAATLLRPALPVSGNQVAAVITFATRKTGVSVLNIESAILSTPDAEEIPYTKKSGGIGVNPDGQIPDASSLDEPTKIPRGTINTGRLVLAGISGLVFLAALGVFVYVLRISEKAK